MQETRFFEDGEMKKHVEVFTGKDVHLLMDDRLEQLHKQGHVLTGRKQLMPECVRKKRGNKGKRLRSAWSRAF